MKIVIIAILGALVSLAGCSSSNNNNDPTGPGNNSPPVTTETGVFLDSPVGNIGYRTETLEGVTNELGEYEYIEGETVTFFIGDLVFPAVTATGTVTPLDIAGTTDTSDAVVVNIIRLLQTLDEDGNPDNGITITEMAKQNATQVDFTLSEAEFESSTAVVSLVANAGSSNVTLISTDEAIAHFEEQLETNGISFGSIDGVWTVRGENAIFNFLPDGSYYAIQFEDEVNGFVGFERGTYETSDTEITFATLQNNDGDALICGGPTTGTCSGINFGYSISGDVLTLTVPGEGDFFFERQLFTDGSIQGAWTLPGDNVVFNFLADGRYFAIQWAEVNGFVGFERGTYQAGDSEIVFTTLQNNDGEALICDAPTTATCSGVAWGYSVTGDALTLTVPGEGDFTFQRTPFSAENTN